MAARSLLLGEAGDGIPSTDTGLAATLMAVTLMAVTLRAVTLRTATLRAVTLMAATLRAAVCRNRSDCISNDVLHLLQGGVSKTVLLRGKSLIEAEQVSQPVRTMECGVEKCQALSQLALN